MVGGRSGEPPPSIVAPAIANHQTHHEVNNETSRRLVASVQGTENQNIDTSLQFSGWCPVFKRLAGAFAWGFGDPFRMNFTGSKNNRTYAVTT